MLTRAPARARLSRASCRPTSRISSADRAGQAGSCTHHSRCPGRAAANWRSSAVSRAGLRPAALMSAQATWPSAACSRCRKNLRFAAAAATGTAPPAPTAPWTNLATPAASSSAPRYGMAACCNPDDPASARPSAGAACSPSGVCASCIVNMLLPCAAPVMRTSSHVISQANPAGVQIAGVAVALGAAGHPPLDSWGR